MTMVINNGIKGGYFLRYREFDLLWGFKGGIDRPLI